MHLRYLFAQVRIKTGSALVSLAMQFGLLSVCAMAAVDSVAMIANGRSTRMFRVAIDYRFPNFKEYALRAVVYHIDFNAQSSTPCCIRSILCFP